MSEAKRMLSFLEEEVIIQQIDAVAAHEGSDRSAIIRRAIRKELSFLASIPTSGYNQKDNKFVKEPQP